MKKYSRRKYQYPVLALVLLTLGGCATATAQQADTAATGQQTNGTELQQLRKEVEALRKENAALRRQLPQNNGPIRPGPAQVRFDGAPVMGDPKAKVAIIEFSDYECPFCRRYHRSTFRQIKHKYIDKRRIQYRYRDFPLSFHPHARSAAVAAHCAGAQGEYWGMLHELFSHDRKLGVDTYRAYARFMHLDEKKFDRCLADSSQLALVKKNWEYGRNMGVDGTPAFFIGKVEGDHISDVTMVVGALPFAAFEQVLNAKLKDVAG
jgi:protein-disulfide isomerase